MMFKKKQQYPIVLEGTEWLSLRGDGAGEGAEELGTGRV